MIKSKNFSTFVLDEDLLFLSNYSNTIWRKLHDKKIYNDSIKHTIIFLIFFVLITYISYLRYALELAWFEGWISLD